MSESSTPEPWHRRALEHRAGLFAVLTTITISIGAIVELVPMFLTDPAAGHARPEPWTPLEVAGRDIYVREGCSTCHSQMVRPLRAETVRYGNWSHSWEYTWDRPFLLGSRRIGPDLARVGGKYPDAWHWQHFMSPQSIQPGSRMPVYRWLYTDRVDPADVTASVQALATLGTPYADTSETGVRAALKTQADGIVGRLAEQGVTAEPDLEVIALIAYVQRLGTMLGEVP